MKKILSLQGVSLWVILFLCFVLYGCEGCGGPKPPVNQVTEVLPSDTLMQAFSQSPPVVQDIFIKKLEKPDKDGNTVLLIASFAKEETRLRGINTLPLNIDEKTQFKLTDQGINGDEIANDGQFSVPLKVSDEELATVINNNKEVLAKQNNLITSFAGRVREVKREFEPITLDSFRLHLKLPIKVFFFTMVTKASMPAIRDKSLMIRDVSVVEDLTRTYDPCRTGNKGNPNGVWSFKTLVANMANQPVTTVTVEQFLIDWVDNFLFSAHTLSSTDASTNRSISKARLIRAWIKNSGLPNPAGTGVPAGWQTMALKAEEFPVRLLAIVNRLDLRGNSGYGGFRNPGEGRFVFAFSDSRTDCGSSNNDLGTMTFIMEYGIPIKNCEALKAYGQQWWDLQSEAFGPNFNTKLQAITDVFTAINADPSKANRSALNHFRTNDFLPATFTPTHPWDIRDFEIDGTTHKLNIIHPSHEPMVGSNGFLVGFNAGKLAAMAAFANTVPFTPANLNPNYTIPDPVKGIHAPIVVSAPDNTPPNSYHWRGNAANPIDPFKRREFSFGTCSGCHKGETRNLFTHIRPRNIGSAAGLSGFMTGMGADDNPSAADDDNDPIGDFFVNDPGPSPLPQKGFNEAFFRGSSLENLVFHSPCLRLPNFPNQLLALNEVLRRRPLNMPH
ncbi:hypothetical protein D3H65_06120 [Paraflavitalea soli]|uniref:Uncharacterized protein n=1 Tax=Paraflavitalea soli TaxID=2315862 RepID=A0A3B7MSU1_9BACT|nr:hypothetical protein [Paraflavitalea soli]AXY73581.1 hypothetical protein D3H65_06120 [Paraflavitalea soli]